MAEETMKDFMDEIDKSLAKGKDGDGFIWDKLHALLDSGEYVDVEVTEAVKGGVVAFLEEKRGFIPASKLSLSYVDEQKLPEFVGKTLKVKVITVEPEEEKLVLSAKEYLKEEAEAKKREEEQAAREAEEAAKEAEEASEEPEAETEERSDAE